MYTAGVTNLVPAARGRPHGPPGWPAGLLWK